MPTIIQAGNVASGGAVTTGATDGILEIRTGAAVGGTSALSVNAAGQLVLAQGITFSNGTVQSAAAAVNQPVIQTHLIAPTSQAIAANTITQITGLNATITPSSATKRIKITVRWAGEAAGPQDAVMGLHRGTTVIGSADAAGVRSTGITTVAVNFGGATNDATTPETAFYQFIDSPATAAAVTYSATYLNKTANTLYNQRTVADTDTTDFKRLTSTIILEEIN